MSWAMVGGEQLYWAEIMFNLGFVYLFLLLLLLLLFLTIIKLLSSQPTRFTLFFSDSPPHLTRERRGVSECL